MASAPPRSTAAPSSPLVAGAERTRLMKLATWASLGLALGLASVKAWAWLQTDSIALLSSLADSALDLLASLLTFGAVRFALSPADAEHRFGHGKAEGLAALAQSLIIGASAVYVAYEAIQRFLAPQPVEEPITGMAVVLGAAAATLVLVLFQRYVSRQTGSVAIAADAFHYKTDLAVNLSVALSLFLATLVSWPWLDPAVGFAVAAYIGWGAWGIATHSLAILLDREIPDEDRDRIRALALQHPAVIGCHDMRTRHGGDHYFVQFHLDLDPNISLLHAHMILDEVEATICKAYPDCEIIIHPDPLGFAEPRDDFKEAVPGAAESYENTNPMA